MVVKTPLGTLSFLVVEFVDSSPGSSLDSSFLSVHVLTDCTF